MKIHKSILANTAILYSALRHHQGGGVCSAFANKLSSSHNSSPSFLTNTRKNTINLVTLRAGSQIAQPPETSITRGLLPQSFGGISYLKTSEQKRHKVVFVLGGPGAGKGTQCENMINHYNAVHHLSVGELLREAKSAGGPDAELIESYLVAGKIVPVEISLGLLEKAMTRISKDSSEVFLVDGFPRNFDNLDGWTRIMGDCSDVLAVFVYECPVEELERRILSRGETSGRSDDNIASARKRFATFENDTMPVIKKLENKVNVVYIAGEKSLEEVWKQTENAMNQIIQNDILAVNQELLDAISNRDTSKYSSLVDESSLESSENILKDEIILLEDGDESTGKQVNSVNNAEINIYGNSAVISYDRQISLDGGKVLSKFRETRTWNNKGDGWNNVHFVRKPYEC